MISNAGNLFNSQFAIKGLILCLIIGNIAFEDMLCITCIPEYYGILHAHYILVDDNFTWLIILTDPSSSCRGWCF